MQERDNFNIHLFYFGCCCVEQCNVPKPQTKSTQSMPMIFLLKNNFDKIFMAILSLEQ